MVSFKPPRKSVVKAYLTDPMTYLAVALLVIGVSIATLYKKEQSTLVQRVSFLKGNNLQIASTNGLSTSGTNQTMNGNGGAQRNIAAESAAPAAPQPMTPPAATSTVVPASATIATPPAAAAATSIAGPTVHVYYAEVPRVALEKLYQESQETGQFNSFGDYTAGILPDVAKRIASPLLKIRVLQKTDKSIAKAQQLFTGIQDPELGDAIGLNTFIELAEMENNVFRGNLEIVRSWKEFSDRAPASIQKNSYPAVFELSPGAGFFVAGVLPRTRSAHEDELSKQGPFQILKSQSFHNKESEFVIFIEFEKKP
ncbi:MAG: hypothetical protein EOP04_18620 [Proteobacteria bacterium]|nr:MAG: hypothetical protein EOP04_18620 [Pseudomonadota bacterium]